MTLLENIYDFSPVTFQNIMCSTKGYMNNHIRYGEAYWKYRKFFNEFDKIPLKEQKKYQLKRLQDFLHFAVHKSKFYASLYKGIDINSIQSIEDLKVLPVVDKEMLRSNIDKIFTISVRDAVIEHTGGTTGKSLIIRRTKTDEQERMAMLDNFKARVGFYNLEMRKATFNGKHIVPPRQKSKIFWRYNSACKQMIYSSFHLTEENMNFYVESLNEFKPMALDGFFSSMCDIASFIERNNKKIDFKPIAIFPTSETVTVFGRKLLERVFCCKVYDQYASSEGAPLITECANQVHHIELASGVFEHLRDDDTEILVTSFTSHGTPLIRYRIGDRMAFPSQYTCNCGLQGTVVDEIQGRNLDYLYTPDGAKINAGNVSNLLKNIPNSIIKAQFIQNTKDEIVTFLEVDKCKYIEDHGKILKDEFRHKFGEKCMVRIEIVDKIPREKSGKFRMIKNNIKELI